MDVRAYDPERDLEDVTRVWREVGWVEDERQEQVLPGFLADADARVAVQDGHAECMVTVHSGRMLVAARDLPVGVVTSVTTSLVGRRRGYARRLCADALVASAARGEALAVLGMFDQGFYDRVGFGTGASMLRHQFDPSLLRVPLPDRTPVRLTQDDAAELHRANQTRQRGHGGITLDSPAFTAGELQWDEPLVALGFRDGDGVLTHYLWGTSKGEHGPWQVYGMVHRTTAQLLELLGLLRLASDQVRSVWLPEPHLVVLDDLLDQPHRHRHVTKGATHAAEVTGGAWWQARILDLPAVVGALSWPGDPVRFVLRVQDPLASSSSVGWSAVDGDWVVELGRTSTAERGTDDTLPSLTASVGALTRLLLGVAPASSLAVTDQIDASAGLLADLDRAITVHDPNPGMYF